MSRPRGVGWFGPVAGGLSGVLIIAIGVALVSRADTAFGLVWSLMPIVCGGVVLLSLATGLSGPGRAGTQSKVTLDGEEARFVSRRDRRTTAFFVIVTLMGGWFLVMGVVGAVSENWFWPVLAVVPAVYFLGFPILRVLGRFRPAGVWVTPTRVVDECLGMRTAIKLGDVEIVYGSTSLEEVYIVPREEGRLTSTRLSPRPWCARTRADEVIVMTKGMPVDPEALATMIRERIDAIQHPEPPKRGLFGLW